MHHESISAKKFIGLKRRMFSPANLSMFTVLISSLYAHLYFLCLRFYHYSPFASKLLNTFSYIATFSNTAHKYFPHTLQHCHQHLGHLATYSKSLIFTASSIVPEVEMSLYSYFFTCFFLAILLIITHYAQYFA